MKVVKAEEAREAQGEVLKDEERSVLQCVRTPSVFKGIATALIPHH